MARRDVTRALRGIQKVKREMQAAEGVARYIYSRVLEAEAVLKALDARTGRREKSARRVKKQRSAKKAGR